MRVKYINEKFTQESDPVYDMGIGLFKMGSYFFNFLENKRGSPHEFPNNCLYIKRCDNDEIVGFLYVWGDSLFYLTYFSEKGKIREVNGFDEFIKLTKKTEYLEKIPIDDLLKLEMFATNIISKRQYNIKNEYVGKKRLYEEFKEKSDPIKDMNIGCKDYEDYVAYELKKAGKDVNEFWIQWQSLMYDSTDHNELIELYLETLKHTPIEYQISQFEETLNSFKNDEMIGYY
jgi:hypothetical protein